MASLYLHIPFCEKKCLYCDFYSIENFSPMEDFLAALDREIEWYAPYAEKTTFETIFLGGGTPSLLTPLQLEKILSRLHTTYSIKSGAEITVETNPGTVTPDKLLAYRQLGVNRLSVGVQSFHEADLKFLSRIHNSRQAIECIDNAHAAGFDNVSLDLIYALPEQSREQWLENLRLAVELAPQHISAYGLIVEDNTPLARLVASHVVSPKPVEEEAIFYELTMEYLDSEGFEHYEVSNYAQPGFRSRHNYNYWSHVNYLGFGPSAHSFWSKDGVARRWFNVANLSHYCDFLNDNKLPLRSEEVLDTKQLATERVFLGLRSDGLKLKQFQNDFPEAAATMQAELVSDLVENGSALLSDDVLRLTPKGFLLCDEICARLMT